MAPPSRSQVGASLRGASDEHLLGLRFADLGLGLKGSWMETELQRLHGQLERRGLRFKPHAWLSTDWFSPIGVPGIAVPFYLAHPRLIRLERRLMLEVEGGPRDEFRRLLRHECGHAIQQAFRLQRRTRWRQHFGSSGEHYPESYRPDPRSRRFVQHLRMFYAQCHPDEDFAETFAVWLGARKTWRSQYAGWPALKKLEYVDELMASLAGCVAPVRSRREVRNLPRLKMTLAEHYAEREERYKPRAPSRYDCDLRALFAAKRRHGRALKAASLLKKQRAEIRRRVARWTGEHQQVLDQVLEEMILRCAELDLRARGSQQALLADFSVLLAARTMAALHAERDWIAV
ncbi:MAG: hypothetical protein ACI9EF_001909 [Pseudohongiellaceae bacterium]|jgi:hypothetical protein